MILRHNLTLLGGCRKRLTDIGSIAYSGNGVAIDPVHRIWMISRIDGTIVYGTYNAQGTLTYGGTLSGIPTGSGQENSGVALDPARGLWWAASQTNNTLVYGTYNTTTGQPTISGSITGLVSETGGTQRVVVDTDLRLWWSGNDTATMVAYGTYNATTGLPTQTGTQSCPNGATRCVYMAIDRVRRLAWLENATYVCSYNTSGVFSATAVANTAVRSGAVDLLRSLLLGVYSSTNYGVWDIAANGALTLDDSLAAGAAQTAVAVDQTLGLAFYSNGHVVSYCK